MIYLLKLLKLRYQNGAKNCGDSVRIEKDDLSTIVSLSDGLGSGVSQYSIDTNYANHSFHASTEFTLGRSSETLAETLPVCKVRKIAYSTFSVMQVFQNGEAYIAEFDSPPIFWIQVAE